MINRPLAIYVFNLGLKSLHYSFKHFSFMIYHPSFHINFGFSISAHQSTPAKPHILFPRPTQIESYFLTLTIRISHFSHPTYTKFPLFTYRILLQTTIHSLETRVRHNLYMAVRGVDFKWYDGFFLSMLATSVIIVSINWKRYHQCTYPLHIWIVVDYTTVFIFRLLMFVDNGLAAGMGLDFGRQQRRARFIGRVAVLSILSVSLYPFLWAWTIIGSLWFSSAKGCLPEDGQKWGFLIWLLFSYSGLICIAGLCMKKWVTRRHAHALRAQQGIPISEYGVLVDMVRVPDWAFESAAGQEMRGMAQDAASYHPGLYLTEPQREAVEALIQELPKFMLKAVPTDCSECPICLEEFRVGNEVRGLPCAHNFHVACIDEWLRLNVKCPRCRCSVFPNLDLSALSTIPADPDRLTVSTSGYMRSEPSSQNYLLRVQGFLCPVRTGSILTSDGGLEAAENGGQLSESHISVEASRGPEE